jgi:hypothetical protein
VSRQALVKADISRQTSDKSEKSEGGNEKKLETIGIKTKGEFFVHNVVSDCGFVGV